MTTILIATRNAHKVSEIRAILQSRPPAVPFPRNPQSSLDQIPPFHCGPADDNFPSPGREGRGEGERYGASLTIPQVHGEDELYGVNPAIRGEDGQQFQFLTLNDFPTAPKVIEDAGTFAGNATKKATELANWLPAIHHPSPLADCLFVLADDSGLEVDALNGAPGVLSARFAAMDSKDNSPDADNNSKLLRLLRDIPEAKRTARFRCVLALTPVHSTPVRNASPVCYADESHAQLFDGACEGKIIFGPRGKNGFGYDPLFVPDGFHETFGELGDAVKNKLSHRAKALEKLKAFLISRKKEF